MKTIKQLALIGPTASGKTALSIKIAQKHNAHILSLDSLALYKETDIVSAKPTLEERQGVKHFGIDMLSPDTHFDVTTFIKLYHSTYALCQKEEKNLVIVGGTSFYLKMLLEGVSLLPHFDDEVKKQSQKQLHNLPKTYAWLTQIDPEYMQSIASNDKYRIEKALLITLQTTLTPSQYFAQNPPIPTITAPLPLYQITISDKTQLRERIAQRTQKMMDEGLIDEICLLEKKYTRSPNAMKAIGIKETLAYLDGVYNKERLKEKIITHTARLAKRQTTFNNSQFKNVIKGDLEFLHHLLCD